MAQKKKKKIVANPARGFATVSQPSKSKDAVDIAEQIIPNGVNTDSENSKDDVPSSVMDPQNSIPQQKQLNQMSPEELEAHLENTELENIVDSYSARCQSEASRQIQRLETERRQGRSQAHRLSTNAWLSDEISETVLLRLQEFQNSVRHDLSRLAVSTASVDETGLLLKLWTLKQVLVAFKFRAIDEALNYVLGLHFNALVVTPSDYVWGLPEALEWYAIYGDAADLPDYDSGMVRTVHNEEDTTFTSVSPPEQRRNSSEYIPRTQHDETAIQVQDATEHSDGEDLTSIDSIGESEEDDDDPSMLVDRFIRLQATLFHIDQKIATGSKKRVAKYSAMRSSIAQRIEKISRDLLFDADSARIIWRDTLKDLQIEAARIRSLSQRNAGLLEQNSASNVSSAGELEAEANEDISISEMFRSNEDQQSSETESKRLQLLDFGKWSGTPPRKLAEEVCRSVDDHCTIRFKKVAATSYSVQLEMNAQWSSPKTSTSAASASIPAGVSIVLGPVTWTLQMCEVAAANALQAESYLSSIFLFLLTASGLSEQKIFMRLPKIWREFHQDLDLKHNQIIANEHKHTLKQLQQMIKTANVAERFDQNTQVLDPSTNEKSRNGMSNSRHMVQQRLTADEARKEWFSRASTTRFADMSQLRERLPIYQYKNEILHAIEQHQLIIICADTGAGKSTQVPSFVLEQDLSSGRDCKILVTQPRRISAISLARRISQELGEKKSALGTEDSLIGYAIRLESKTSRATKLTLATTGVLLRMLESSANLDELNYLILDEVHERTLDLDLLFIALRRLQMRRSDLKIILMSATVDAQKFSRYFDDAPIVDVPGRTFPVTVKYLEDAIEESASVKGSQHAASDLYVNEADDADSEDNTRSDNVNAIEKLSLAGPDKYTARTRSTLSQMDELRIDYNLIAKLAILIATSPKYANFSKAMLIFMPGIGEIKRLQNVLLSDDTFSTGWVVHLLHSSFATEDLEKAFAPPPRNHRKIVIATNIAETGITIPDVTAVIDTCKEKIMRFDERRQLSKLTEIFISRSSARQRKGRAARVQEGLCFHLVTRHRYENLMLEQHIPEMLRLSLQDPAMRIKVWQLGSIEETLASAIDPPTPKNVRRAIGKLKDAGALDSQECLTALGKLLARLPLDVAMSKLAIFGITFRCLDSILAIIAMLSSKSPFLVDKAGSKSGARLAFSRGESDLISSLNAYQGWKKAKIAGKVHQYCRKHYLSEANLEIVEDQKIQLMVYLVDAGVLVLDASERAALNKSRTSNTRKAFFETPQRYIDLDSDALLCSIIALAFYPKMLLREGRGWRNVYSNQYHSIGPGSINRGADKPPKWLCFYEAMQVNLNLNVFETSRIPEAAIVLLMGNVDIKFFSGLVVLDNGKVRFSLKQWRHVAVMKTLRQYVMQVLDRAYDTPGLLMNSSDREWIEILGMVLVGRDKMQLQLD